jgi:hypothetical protein
MTAAEEETHAAAYRCGGCGLRLLLTWSDVARGSPPHVAIEEK